MLTTRAIIWAMVAPACIALASILLAAIPRWRRRSVKPWGAALAIAGALGSSYFAIAEWPSFPPALAEAWLVYLVGAGVVVGILATIFQKRAGRIALAVLSAVALVVTAWLLMRPRGASVEAKELCIQTSIIAATFVVWWLAMDQLAIRAPGPGIPILLSLFVAGGAMVLVNSHTQSLGQVAGGVAIAMGVIGVMAIYLRELSLGRGAILALAIGVLGLDLCGHLYADMTGRELAILAGAPVAMWLGELPGVRKKAWMRFGVRAVTMLIVLSIVVVPATKGLRETMREQTESYGY